MFVNVRINTQSPRGRKIIKELKRLPKAVEFDNPAVSGIIPKGYMTADDFKKSVINKINNYCDKNGIL